MRIFFKILVFLSLTSCVFGPIGISKKALKKLNDQDFTKAEQLVAKALAKDSLLPASKYAKSRLLIAYDSPEFYDSAYLYVLSAQSILDTLHTKSKVKHIKHGFDSVTLMHHKTLIDSLAFQWTQRVNTEAGYNEFLEKYPTAQQVLMAKTRRNAIAFASAKEENTYQSYKLFMEKYPEAVQVKEARNRYEKLYFDKSTADGRVTSYIRFLEKHPETPYRREAEQKIFEVMTSEHSAGGYELFLRNYPKSHLRQRAINFAYHVAKASEDVRLNARYLSDSLRKVIALEDIALFAYLEEGKFGFFDNDGKVVITPQFGQIHQKYKCESTKDDFLLVEGTVKGRNGAIILDKQPEQVIDLGYGLLKVGSENNWRVVHKSGIQIRSEAYSEAKLLAGKMLALKKGNLWSIETVSGRLLIADNFDDVFVQSDFIFFEKDDLIEVKTDRQLLQAVDNTPGRFEYIFTDYEILPDGNIWLASSFGEMIANEHLEELIPYANQKINILNGSFLVKKQTGARLYDQSYKVIKEGLSSANYNQSWLIDKQDSALWMFDLQDYTISTRSYDSAQLLGRNFLQVFKGDTTAIYFRDGLKVPFVKTARFNVLGNEATEYLKVFGNKRMQLYNQYGSLLLDENPVELSALSKNALVFTEKNKKGLIDGRSGDKLLNARYDAIGNFDGGKVSLLRDKQFGLFDLKSRLLIEPAYDKNIISYNDSVFVASKGNRQYFTTTGEPFTEEGFDQVEYWSDTTAIVRMNITWNFFDLKSKTTLGPSFKSYQIQSLPSGEKLITILGENGYGVFSDRRGEVVSPTYNDVVILSSDDEPILFTEKHIKEASFFVVIYYDLDGNALLKKAYESKQYDRIYCDQ